MSVVRGTALSSYPSLVTDLGGDPLRLLTDAGVRPADVGKYDVFIPFSAVLQAVESAASATATVDFGRRLAERQGIEILGPVGVAARTAPTVAVALAIFGNFMAAYSPALAIRVMPGNDPSRSFIAIEFLSAQAVQCPQSVELALGVSLKVLRFFLGSDWSPLSVHLPHTLVAPRADYLGYFGCRPYPGERTAGFTVRSADLARQLHRDDVAHRAIVEYLDGITARDSGLAQSIRTIVRQLLPTGAASLDVIAAQFRLHPKTLQRRLADEGVTFAGLVDEVRRESAEHYLRATDMSLSHLTHELGYAEQSVLTRSCRRWFGCGPSAYRRQEHLPPRSPVRA